MKDFNALAPHPMMETLVDNLMLKTQNQDPQFFRLMVSYNFCKIASMMRCNVKIAETQLIPINMYGINLAPSGAGKGHSTGIMEESVMGGFRTEFIDNTFPTIAERSLNSLGLKRAQKLGVADPDEEVTRAQLEFEELGQLLFSFDSGTPAAVKQMRTKLLMAGAGSMNFEMDEMGSNLLGNSEILNTFLELFDVGRIKQKLVKNTRENIRSEDLFGMTPTNMMLYGTPTKVMNGSKTEEEYFEFLDIGYARRCFFGFCRMRNARSGQTAQDIYDIYNDTASIALLSGISAQMKALADNSFFGQTIKMDKDVSMALFEYRLWCQEQADTMSEYENVAKAELSHRYFKVAKLAGAYAFVDKSPYVTMGNLENAIFLAEESGIAFNQMMKRDRPHVKLAKYLAGSPREFTHADLMEDLPFFKGSEQTKREMVNLATAYGYRNNIVVRRDIIDGMEILSATSVPETDIEKIIFSAGTDITTGFGPHRVPFRKMHNLVAKDGFHWVNHVLKDGYRDDMHVVEGFNLLCLDVEKSVSIDLCHQLMGDYKYLLHTTKRHTDEEHRYRVILPMSHTLSLDADDYKEFMQNVFAWLPFDVDTGTGQRSRKWLTNAGHHQYNDGQLLDALQFVPKTKKAEDFKEVCAGQVNMSNLQRWFINHAPDGNRNNQLIKYAYALIDAGDDLSTIQLKVMDLNKKLPKPLGETEVLMTIIPSATKKYHSKRK